MFGQLFFKGLIIGMMVSIPLGPIGLYIIQKTVNKNRLAGIISGFGVSLADAIYAVIAGFSLTYILNFIRSHELFFQVLGAVILLLLGVHVFRKNPVSEVRKYRKKGSNYFQDFLFTFLITISNPGAVFIFLAVLTGSKVVLHISRPYEAFFIIAGVFTGGSLWWIILVYIVGIFRHRFNLRLLWWFNKIAGVVIILIVIIASVYFLVTGKIF
ncbi:MAG: LysE family transporter [Prolixibacteraceae bacterium]|nr:LysE family transporter [Prolixibacteraceae bacterium]MBN2774379.1 LysE family transporter [Prolixibacteraceae bacterium]